MSTRSYAQALQYTDGDLMNKIKTLEKDILDLTVERIRESADCEAKLKCISDQLDLIKKDIMKDQQTRNELANKVKKLEIEYDRLKQKLEKEIDKLNADLKRSERDELKLKVGQIGFLFEQAICWKVFPEIFDQDATSSCTLKRLMKFLNMNVSQIRTHVQRTPPISGNQLKDAQERFKTLKSDLNWDEDWKMWPQDPEEDKLFPNDMIIVNKIKSIRVEVAHPKVDLDEVLAVLPSDFKSPIWKDLGLPPWSRAIVHGFIQDLQAKVKMNILEHPDLTAAS